MHIFTTPNPHTKPYCGGDLESALNICLGNLVNLAGRAQAFHWSVEGPEFHQYHQFFQVIYEDLYKSVDDFAENILISGYSVPLSLKKILMNSTIQCDDVETTPESLTRSLYESNKKCIEDYELTVSLAKSLGKELAFVSGQIDLQRKWDWQLRTATKDANFPSTAHVTHVNIDIEVEKKDEALKNIFQKELDPSHYDPMLAAAPANCPPATLDIEVNLENRKNAIDTAMYGPLNPAEPNNEYWQELADEWSVDADTARKQTCASCAMFNISTSMKDCISEGVGSDRFDLVDAAGELGYCEAFDFKCASARTCRAWVGGGPISDESEPVTAAMESAKKSGASTPAPKKDQIKGSSKNKPDSASDAKNSITLDASTEKALENKVKEHNENAEAGRKASLSMLKAVYRRGAGAFSTSHRPGLGRNQWAMARVNAFLHLLDKGKPKKSAYTQDNDLLPAAHPRSTKNSAAIFVDGHQVPAEILFDPEIEEELDKKVEKFNERAPLDKKLSFSTLKAVYRRGALSYPDVNRSGRSREEWAMDRTKAFIRLFSAGKSSNPAYTHDNDLLLPSHPEFLRSEATMVASGQSISNSIDHAEYVETQLQPDVRSKTSDYTSVSDAILSLTEISGLGYGAEVAFKAAWMRAINEGSDPYARVKTLALNTYNSPDADLLPEKKDG